MYDTTGHHYQFVTPLPSMSPRRWISPRDAAAYLGISKATLYRKVNDGYLPRPHKTMDGLSRFRVEDLDAYAMGLLPEDKVTAPPRLEEKAV